VSTSYEPGVCNIGRAEQSQRYTYAGVAAVVAVGYLGACLLLDLPSALLAGVFVPLALAVEWFVQARTSFCVRFALLGRYDAPSGDVGEVTDRENRRADVRQSVRITALSIGVAALATAAVFALFA
jgi:hypothetical protein